MNIRINICELSFMYQSLLQKHFFCSVVLNFTSYRFICAMYTTDDGQVLVHKVLSNCKLWQGVKLKEYVCKGGSGQQRSMTGYKREGD